jgi:hypothetical protein
MEIAVVRPKSCGQTCTISELYIDGGSRQCFILEDVVREVQGQPVASWKVKNETAIPVGRYKVVVTYSPHFRRELPLLLEVPGYEGVRIHAGNTAADTEGCLIVGSDIGADGESVVKSRIAFDDFFDKINAASYRNEEITLTIG